jgi:hypothetical protein
MSLFGYPVARQNEAERAARAFTGWGGTGSRRFKAWRRISIASA